MREDGGVRYYRFELPGEKRNGVFPDQIELFSHKPPFIDDASVSIAPLPFDGTLSSLSAIVLDEEYFRFLKDGIIDLDGVPVPDALHIIPLKMRAHIDLNDRHLRGERINQKDLRKHRKDVLDLSGLLASDASCPLIGGVARDAERFLDGLPAYVDGLRRRDRANVMDASEFLHGVYGV